MALTPIILVTGTMSRPDLLAMFDGLGEAARLVFVEYAAEWGEGVSSGLYAGYGALRTWETSGSAKRLLDEVHPDLVAFVSCTSYNQVALRCAAGARGVRCVHLEHGLRRAPASPFGLTAAQPGGGPRLSSWRTHAFFGRSALQDRRAAWPLLRYAADVSVRGSSDETLCRHADLRRLDHYISFSAECFDYHRHVDRVAGRERAVTFVGVPQFDVYAAQGARQVDESAAILVDHQLVNDGLLGWDLAFRDRWAAELASTLADAGMTLHVKEHPGDRTRTWQRLGARNVRIVHESELPALAREARTVLGLASTLQMPLAALAHVAHIALELHPMAGAVAAQAFVDAGVAEPVRSFAELAAALARRAEIAATQRRSKAAFERRFLFALDGRSGERFREALLSQARHGSASYDRAMTPTPTPTAVAGAVKLVARRLLDSHPLLRGNRVVHEIQRRRAYRDIELRPELTSRPDLLRELDERGVAMVPGYVDRATVARMLAAAEEHLERARRGELDDTFSVQPSVVVRLARADLRIPETRPFFHDEVIRGVMRAYMSPDVSSYRRELEYRFGLSQAAQADLYHFDNWRPICKAFLYLADVTDANAPFVYVAGSHKRAAWRVEHEIAYDARGVNGRFGHLFPQEMRELRARHGWSDLVCTGAAGTLILADFRGLHRGTPLVQGRRVLLNNTFDLMNPEAV
jgi:hypothetical protein